MKITEVKGRVCEACGERKDGYQLAELYNFTYLCPKCIKEIIKHFKELFKDD